MKSRLSELPASLEEHISLNALASRELKSLSRSIGYKLGIFSPLKKLHLRNGLIFVHALMGPAALRASALRLSGIDDSDVKRASDNYVERLLGRWLPSDMCAEYKERLADFKLDPSDNESYASDLEKIVDAFHCSLMGAPPREDSRLVLIARFNNYMRLYMASIATVLGPISEGAGCQRESGDQTDLWHELLASAMEDDSIVESRNVGAVVALLAETRVDPEKFRINLDALLRRGMPSIQQFYGVEVEGSGDVTPSLERYISPLNRPRGMPIWMLAAFPDVAQWLSDELKALWDSGLDEEQVGATLARLYGIDEGLIKGGLEEDFADAHGRLQPRYYRNLVLSYLRQPDRALETASR